MFLLTPGCQAYPSLPATPLAGQTCSGFQRLDFQRIAASGYPEETVFETVALEKTILEHWDFFAVVENFMDSTSVDCQTAKSVLRNGLSNRMHERRAGGA